MLTYKQREDGYIAIDVSAYMDKDIISCISTYSADGVTWHPASIKRTLQADYMTDRVNGRMWNLSVLRGMTHFYKDDGDACIYWNKWYDIPYETGRYHFKAEFVTASGAFVETVEMDIGSDACVVLNDWDGYLNESGILGETGKEDGWQVGNYGKGLRYLTATTNRTLPDLSIRPKVEGLFDVWIGLGNENARFAIGTSKAGLSRILFGGDIHRLYPYDIEGKDRKEIHWKAVDFTKDTELVLSKLIVTSEKEFSFGNHKVGKIHYIKLVPRKEPEEEKKRPLILYHEHGSYIPVFNDISEDKIKNVLDNFMRFSPMEITSGVCRIGASFSSYNSKLIRKPEGRGEDPSDDNVVYRISEEEKGPDDLLRVISGYLKVKDVLCTATIGMNRPYLHTKSMTATFVHENPDTIKNGYLDYANPKVMEYALGIAREIVEQYPIDGLFLDFMRTEENQTADTLAVLMRGVRAILDTKKNTKGKRMRLSVRIPVERIEYYQSARIWAEERLVDVVVPSHPAESMPPPESNIM